MQYIKGTVYTSSTGIEIISDRLFGIGVVSLEINDPADFDELLNKKHGYEWDYIDETVMEQSHSEPSVSFYCDVDDAGKELCESIKAEVQKIAQEAKDGMYGDIDMGRMVCEISVEDDSEWKDKWKEYFKPAHITDKIVVKPTWEEYTKQEGELVIEIDPGAAFGTGTHPTTTGCIVLMEKYLKPGAAVLDVGCGSGILAIAAKLLGAGDVLGIEIDPQAVEVGQENVRLNGFGEDGTVRVQYGDLTKGVQYKADIIVANLMADLVKMLSKDAAAHLKPGGVYICSGILLDLCDDVSEALTACGFRIIDVYRDERDGGWCAIAAVCD